MRCVLCALVSLCSPVIAHKEGKCEGVVVAQKLKGPTWHVRKKILVDILLVSYEQRIRVYGVANTHKKEAEISFRRVPGVRGDS